MAREKSRKKRRRKPYIRYEREHSMSSVIDWFEKAGVKPAILDDSSRKILVAGEFENANTTNSIALIDKLVENYWDILPMKELISDNGSELKHRRNGKKEWDKIQESFRFSWHKADYSKNKASSNQRKDREAL